MRCPLVLACDAGYAMPLATTLRSAVEANAGMWPLDIVILSYGFPAEARAKVTASLPDGAATIAWIEVDLDAFASFATADHISKTTYARLLIATLLPPEIERVLYLDADLLVLGNLAPLMAVDLGGAVVGAVLDGLDAQVRQGLPAVRDVPRVNAYFNAGVLLIDLVRWRAEAISERAIAYLADHPKTPFSDQDALNVACDGRWKALERSWNFVPFGAQVPIDRLPIREQPAIVHFATSHKPWNARFPNLNAALHDRYRQRTKFARTPLEKAVDGWTSGVSAFKRYVRHFSRRSSALRQVPGSQSD